MFFLLLLTLGQERCLMFVFCEQWDMALQCVQHWSSGTQVSYSWWAVPSCLACIRTQELFGGIGMKIPCEPCFWGIGEQQEWAALWGKAGWELRVTRGSDPLTGGAVLQLSNKKSSRVTAMRLNQQMHRPDLNNKAGARSNEQMRVREVLRQAWAHLQYSLGKD